MPAGRRVVCLLHAAGGEPEEPEHLPDRFMFTQEGGQQ